MDSVIDALSIVAEFSIGLAGFSGIVAVFANSRERVSAALRFRLSNLLVTAFAPGFVALFVISLLYGGLSEAMAIKLGSGVFAIYLTAWAIFAPRARHRIPKSDPQQLNARLYWFNRTATMVNIGAQIANTVLWLDAAPGLLVAGLALMLLLGAITFAAMVIQMLESQVPAP